MERHGRAADYGWHMQRAKKIILCLLTAVLLAAAAGWRAWFAQPRAPRREYAPPPADMPPAMLFTTVALGGFRGIMADLLWMRLIYRQEAAQPLEIVQLSNWITALEPRFVRVWAFHAWNMAYNVSVMFDDPADRWRWVQHGIRLLRDRALYYNPGHPVLLRELGWLYQHKIGFVMDQAHHYYKARLAEEMHRLLDGPRPDYQAAPAAVMRLLREDHNLQPAIMAQLEREYGPFDWRLPATHALYWSYQGRRQPADRPGVAECHRMFFQSMAEAFRHGRLDYDPATGFYMATPDLDLLPNVMRAYEESLALYDLPDFHMAYANFLAEAVVLLYVYQRGVRARALYGQLIRTYPGPQGDPEFEDFVMAGLIRNLPEAPREDVMGLVEGFLYQAHVWSALGERERAAGALSMARLIWGRFMQARVSEDHRRRTGLPPLEEINTQARRRALRELPPAMHDRLVPPAHLPEQP